MTVKDFLLHRTKTGRKGGKKKIANANEWVLIDDTKPPFGESIIICFRMKYSFEKEWRYIVCEAYQNYFGDGYLKDAKHGLSFDTYNDWDEGEEFEIIAWMPLPKPIKIDEN